MKEGLHPEFTEATITHVHVEMYLQQNQQKKDIKSRCLLKMSSILDRKLKTKYNRW